MSATMNDRGYDPSRGRWIPWAFAGGLLLVVAVNAVLVYYAVSTFTGVTTPRAYEQGRRYDEVLVQMWALLEDGRRPESHRIKVPDVVDNRRTLLGMVESGLILSPGPILEFTARGRIEARDLVRRRRLAEVLFTSALHLPEPEVETVACRMEHIIDPEVTASICSFLGHPRTCPHGKPIPSGNCCELPIIS